MTFTQGYDIFEAGGGGMTRRETFDTKATTDGSGNSQGFPLDIVSRMLIFITSIPAKPLLCMLNSGGFFLCRGAAR